MTDKRPKKDSAAQYQHRLDGSCTELPKHAAFRM